MKTDNYTHVMKYMGSKRELLGEIKRIISKQDLGGKAVLDLFAGTCGVGMALRDVAPIYSNDIQQYSAVISEGCLSVKTEPLNKDEILKIIENDYKKNYRAIKAILPKTSKKSEAFTLIKEWTDVKRIKYIKFAEQIATNALTGKTRSAELGELYNQYLLRQRNSKAFPYIQTTTIFSEMYFSLEQATSIDSIRYAIDNLSSEYKKLEKPLLTALIHAYSYASAGTGHFAQFRDLSTISSVKDVFIYRRKSVLDLFVRKAEEILLTSEKNKHHERSKSFSRDYLEILSDSSVTKNIGIIYADPPYSFVHYSRFYHAIEDLCRYDYPEVEHKGRYRKDRHQSPFCIKSKAPSAFDDMFKAAYKDRLPLLVSYANTGMISLGELDEIASENGYTVEALEVNHKHSTMGRQKDKYRDVKEALLLCRISQPG